MAPHPERRFSGEACSSSREKEPQFITTEFLKRRPLYLTSIVVNFALGRRVLASSEVAIEQWLSDPASDNAFNPKCKPLP